LLIVRILGIDYGTKRIGLAVSDELGMLARELDILSPKLFFDTLPDIIADHEIDTIVLGLPLNMSGQETKKTQEVKSFKLQVESVAGIPVILIDERLSSVMASHLPGGQKNVDSLAAQIILQNYLDSIKRHQ
jgi:putative Holliday junction resolvase